MVSRSSIFFLLYSSDCGHNGLQAELSVYKVLCGLCSWGQEESNDQRIGSILS
jgi:hypothetical protein